MVNYYRQLLRENKILQVKMDLESLHLSQAETLHTPNSVLISLTHIFENDLNTKSNKLLLKGCYKNVLQHGKTKAVQGFECHKLCSQNTILSCTVLNHNIALSHEYHDIIKKLASSAM